MTAKRKRKPKTPKPEPLPRSHLDRIKAMGLTVICYSNVCITVEPWANGEPRSAEWLPRDLVGDAGKTVIIFRPANDGNYYVAGWEPWHDGMFGGRCTNIHNALAWVERARDICAGRATHF